MPIESSSNNKIQSIHTLQTVEPTEINRRIIAGDTFVVNIVAAWCPDCTERQAPHIDGFTQKMNSADIDVLQVNVQLQKGDFISVEHEQVTTLFGGHGFPRTVLIKNGDVVDKGNVEVVTENALSALASKFIKIVTES
jgi:thiol-disulfide isomerase/thioredoxin